VSNSEEPNLEEFSQRLIYVADDEFWPELLADEHRLTDFLNKIDSLSKVMVSLVPRMVSRNTIDSAFYGFFESLHRVIGHLGFRLVPLHEPSFTTVQEAFESVTKKQILFAPDSLEDYKYSAIEILNFLHSNLGENNEFCEIINNVMERVVNVSLIYPSILEVINDHKSIEPEKVIPSLEYFSTAYNAYRNKLQRDAMVHSLRDFQSTVESPDGTIFRTVEPVFCPPYSYRVNGKRDRTLAEQPSVFKFTSHDSNGDVTSFVISNLEGINVR